MQHNVRTSSMLILSHNSTFYCYNWYTKNSLCNFSNINGERSNYNILLFSLSESYSLYSLLYYKFRKDVESVY